MNSIDRSGGGRASAGEFELISQFRRLVKATGRVPVGIGDDCAVLSPPLGADLLVTTDMLMDGRHFHLEEAGPERVGRKAMGVNISDIAAMAGRPFAAVVSVALPRASAGTLAEALFRGLLSIAEREEVDLVGGDTNAWEGPLVVSVTVLGSAVHPGPALRSVARVGDTIFVTGPVGGSLLGRHLDPRPRVREALAIRERVDRLAMIDISDGLASDLGHILEESGHLGAMIDLEALPIHPDANEMTRRDGRPVIDHALGDGEDFELCLTVGPQEAAGLQDCAPPGVTLFPIGTVIETPGLWTTGPSGTPVSIGVRGFDHLLGPS